MVIRVLTCTRESHANIWLSKSSSCVKYNPSYSLRLPLHADDSSLNRAQERARLLTAVQNARINPVQQAMAPPQVLPEMQEVDEVTPLELVFRPVGSRRRPYARG